MATVHRNMAEKSLLAARQLYGPEAAATTLERPDVFCVAQTEATSRLPSEKGQLCAIKRRKRPRSTPKNQPLDAQVATPTGWRHQVPSKAAQRLAATMQVGDVEASSGMNEPAIRPNPNSEDLQAQLSGNKNSYTSSDGLPATRSLTPESSECNGSVGCTSVGTASVGTESVGTASVGTASVDTASVTTKAGRNSSRQKVRDGRRKKAADLKPVGGLRAANGPAKHAHGALNDVSTMSQREVNRRMRLLMPGEQREINRVLKKFAAQIDGKSMRTRDLFDLVSSPPQHIDPSWLVFDLLEGSSYVLTLVEVARG